MYEKIYLLHHSKYHKNDYDKELQEIIEINPDKILLFCLEEADASYIFERLFIKLSPWLIANNKTAKVLMATIDNMELAPNIYTEKTFGYHLISKSVIEGFDMMGIDFTKSHTYANKLYTCYNNSMKYHRAMTIDTLAKEKMLDDGIITAVTANNVLRDYQEYGGKSYKWKYYNGKIRKDEVEINDTRYFGVISGSMPRSFLSGLIDIVTETQYGHWYRFVTEKTIKSIAALKPFLCVGSMHFHNYLQEEYNILPYSEIFDYSFDSCQDIESRVNGVISNVKKLKYLMEDTKELNRIHDLLLPKMLHNKAQVYNYALLKEKMIPKSLNFCIDGTDYKLFGDVEECKYVFDYYKKMSWIKQ